MRRSGGVTAGWHVCIDVAERWLGGKAVGRIVGDEARRHGGEELEKAYAARFGTAG